MLFYVILLLLNFTKIILLLLSYLINYFFHENCFCFFMFRDVPACSGMFRVPGFIDARHSVHLALTVEVFCTFLLFLVLIEFSVILALNFIMEAFRRIGWDAQRLYVHLCVREELF